MSLPLKTSSVPGFLNDRIMNSMITRIACYGKIIFETSHAAFRRQFSAFYLHDLRSLAI